MREPRSPRNTPSGSEFYRGLGSVVVGGLTVSTVFTIVLVPAVFSLVLEWREGVSGRIMSIRTRIVDMFG